VNTFQSGEAIPRYFRDISAADSVSFINNYEAPVLLTFTDVEKVQYENIPSLPEKKEYIKKYIRKKDKNPLFAYNLWFLEFMDRLNYAKKHFPIQNSPYFDDRGAAIIKHGRPIKRFEGIGGLKRLEVFYDDMMDVTAMNEADANRNQSVVESQVSANNQEQANRNVMLLDQLYQKGRAPNIDFYVKPNETWFYQRGDRDFTIHFVKESTFRQVESLSEALHTRRQSNVAWQWAELIKERDYLSIELGLIGETIRDFEEKLRDLNEYDASLIGMQNPHMYLALQRINYESKERNAQYKFGPDADSRFRRLNSLDFQYDTAQFRNSDGSTRIEVFVVAPIREMLENHVRQDRPDSLELIFGSMVRNSDYNPVTKSASSVRFSSSATRNIGYNNAVGSVILMSQPVVGELTVNMLERYENRMGFRQQEFAVRDFSGEELMISDIQIYAGAENTRLGEVFPVTSIGSVNVIPYPFREIRKTEPMLCYFEIYNIQSAGIREAYDIEIQVSISDSLVSTFERFRNFITRSKKFSTGVKQNRLVESNDSRELISLDISALKSGMYNFEVLVSDTWDDKKAVRAVRTLQIR